MGNTPQRMIERTPQNYKEREEDSSFTCEICKEPLPHKKKFKNKKSCVHPFCLDCIAMYIQVKVEDHISEVKCPGLNCKRLLDPLSCRPILSPQLFEKWCDVLCNSSVLTCERVYCPFSDCSTLILDECNDNPRRTECPNCKNFFCFNCKLPWHEGVQCGENGKLIDTNDILFAKLVERQKWKRCPSCNHFVELLSGCMAVKCRCGTSFCHACGRERSSKHMCWSMRSVSYHLLLIIVFFSFVLPLLLTNGLYDYPLENQSSQY